MTEPATSNLAQALGSSFNVHNRNHISYLRRPCHRHSVPNPVFGRPKVPGRHRPRLEKSRRQASRNPEETTTDFFPDLIQWFHQVTNKAHRAGRNEFCGEGTESRCRIPSCRADGLPRELSMTNEARKREKAVKKIETAVRKAVGKGVSQKVVEDTVGQAIAKATEKVAAKKEAVKKTPAKEAPAKKAVAKKAPAKKAVVKKAPVKKVVAKKAPAEKVVPKEAPLDEAVVKKAPAEVAVVKKVPAKEVVA